MKKYNSVDAKLFLLGMLVPTLLFLISLSSAYAYFTASAIMKNTEQSTAILKIQFSDTSSAFTSSKTITSSTKLVPGDTIEFSGSVENVGDIKVYAILNLKITVTKQNSETEEVVVNKFYTINSNKTIEIIQLGESYSSNAFTIEKGIATAFNCSYIFDVDKFDNSYKNAYINYELNAYALQFDTIEDASIATQMIFENFVEN